MMAVTRTVSTSVSAINSSHPFPATPGPRAEAPDFSRIPIMMIRMLSTLLGLFWLGSASATATYQEPADFLSEVFAGKPPEPAIVWLSGERKQQIRTILGHEYSSLRVRYWGDTHRSAWILDEIGKEHPITTGIVVEDGRIELIRVLVFRESRGWEVRYPFFTDQFLQARLDADQQLDRTIDNISGATLSVRALTKLARMALYLSQQLSATDVTPAP